MPGSLARPTSGEDRPAGVAVDAADKADHRPTHSTTMPIGTRVGTGVALLVAGATHLWSWSHGYRHTSVGPAFLVDTTLSAAVGLLVLARGNRVAAWTGSIVAAGALVAYAMARTVGLFGFVERTWTASSLVAAGCESLVVVLLVTEVLVPPPAA